jgi:hypothetical protein
MFVTVRSPKALEMWVENTLPASAAVNDWLNNIGAETYANGFRFEITPDNYGKLPDLADAVLAIVRPGARYDTPAYKYVSPRTARSLRRLHKVLSQHWD